MTPATLIVGGTIVDYSDGVLTIKAQCDDWHSIVNREIKSVKVQLLDGRKISNQQRKACYALIKAIADWSGDDATSTKVYLKTEFWAEHIEDLGDKIFSLSDAPVSLVAEFQRYLVRFIVSNQIPLKFGLLDFVDDESDYIYSCLINKRCCVCGKASDLHHVDQVGMGRDRHDIIHQGMRVLPLCREHHNQAHTAGRQSFLDYYHITDGIVLDKTLCKLYGLKGDTK